MREGQRKHPWVTLPSGPCLSLQCSPPTVSLCGLAGGAGHRTVLMSPHAILYHSFLQGAVSPTFSLFHPGTWTHALLQPYSILGPNSSSPKSRLVPLPGHLLPREEGWAQGTQTMLSLVRRHQMLESQGPGFKSLFASYWPFELGHIPYLSHL